MSSDPAFLMYSKDWLSGTAEYMPDEKGVYIDLLCYQHQNNGLPKDTERLAKMVGLSHESFLKIWQVISKHFIESDNRMVNQKLQKVMNNRAEKSHINTITGTFAGILRLGNYSSRQYKYLRDNFKVSNFINYPKEEITERLTEWIDTCLKSIGNGNEDVNNYKKVLEKVLSENSIILPEGFEPLILEWLQYKSEKGQSYKPTGLKNLLLTFIEESGSDKEEAKKMLKYSMSKNYTGLFKDKSNGSNRQNTGRHEKRVNDLWK